MIDVNRSNDESMKLLVELQLGWRFYGNEH